MKKITSLQKCVFGVRKKRECKQKIKKNKKEKEKLKNRKKEGNGEKLQLRQNILECGIKVSSAMFA